MGRAGETYDEIGGTYLNTRREDPRVAAQIHSALGPGSVVNVGAGTGNYEPAERLVVAVEPSAQMLEQRSGESAPAVRSVAESLPFSDGTFDNSMAVLTLHHWSDPATGLHEMARVSRRQVVFFFERAVTHRFWALDYFPEALSLPTEQAPPGEQFLRSCLDVHRVERALVPADCVDGFGAAFWARPEAYLHPDVQAGTSWLAMLSDRDREAGTRRLRTALESGEWDRRHGDLRSKNEFDAGYRIAVAGTSD